MQTLDDFVLVSALPLLQLTLLYGFPDQWSRATVTGEQIKGNGGLVVSLEVGPIKSDSQRLSLSYYERNPARKERPHRDCGVAQKPVYLLDGMLRVEPLGNGQALTDVVHGQGCRVHHADNAVGQLKHALRMKIITDNLLNELVHVPGRQFRLRCSAPQGPRFFKLLGRDRFFHHPRWTKPLRTNSRARKKRPRNEGILQVFETTRPDRVPVGQGPARAPSTYQRDCSRQACNYRRHRSSIGPLLSKLPPLLAESADRIRSRERGGSARREAHTRC